MIYFLDKYFHKDRSDQKQYFFELSQYQEILFIFYSNRIKNKLLLKYLFCINERLEKDSKELSEIVKKPI